MRCSSSSPLARPSVLLFILSVIFTAAYNGPRVNFIAALVNVQEDDACKKEMGVLKKYNEEHYDDPAYSDFNEAVNALIDAVAAADPDFAKAKNAVVAACGDNWIAAIFKSQEDEACKKAFEEASVVFDKLGPEHLYDPEIADKLAAFIQAYYEFIQAVAADYPDVVKALMDLAACLAPETAYLRGSI